MKVQKYSIINVIVYIIIYWEYPLRESQSIKHASGTHQELTRKSSGENVNGSAPVPK